MSTGYRNISYPCCQPFRQHIPASHGVRTVENLRKHCGIEDPDLLEVAQPSGDSLGTFFGSSRFQKEAQRFEEAIVTSSTKNGRPGIVKLEGAAQILNDVRSPVISSTQDRD